MRNSTHDWKMHIEHTLPNFNYAGYIPILGKAFFDEPHQFSGFLLWLLEKGVTPCEIVNAGILQQYFEYAIIELEQLKLPYALLKPFSSAAGFLKYLETVPPYPTKKTNTFLFMNQNAHDQAHPFQSYNLMGDIFYHAEKFPLGAIEFSEKLILKPEITERAIPLFELFGFELLNALNFRHALSKIILSVLLREKQNDLLKKIAALDSQNDIAILKYIAESCSDMTVLQNLIDHHPFCIYLLAFQPQLFETLSASLIENALNIVLTHPNIQSRYHAALLCQLCEQAEPITSIRSIIKRLKTHLFEWVLKNDTLMSDELVEHIEQLNGLNALCRERIKKYYLEILSSIDAFFDNKIIFDNILVQWGRYIRDVNIFVEMDPPIKETEHYPFTKYALYALALQKKWGKQFTDNRPFDLSETVHSMICAESNENDHEKVQRILLESLVYTKEPTLLEHILEKIVKTDTRHVFLTCHFDDKNIIEHAIDKHHHLLLSYLLPLKNITLPQLTDYLEKAWVEKNWQAIQTLLKTQKIPQKIINQLLMHCYATATESESGQDSYAAFDDQAVRFFCDPNNGYPAPNLPTFSAVLFRAIGKQHYALVCYLCEQKFLFTQITFDMAAKYAVSTQHWDLLEALYRTHNTKKVARTTQKIFLSVVANYPDQLTSFLNYIPKEQLTQRYITEGIKIATDQKRLLLAEQLKQLLHRPHKHSSHFFAENPAENHEEDEILLSNTSTPRSTPLSTPPPEPLASHLCSL